MSSKKNETLIYYPPIGICQKRSFKAKTESYLQLLPPETITLVERAKNKKLRVKVEKICPHLQITDII